MKKHWLSLFSACLLLICLAPVALGASPNDGSSPDHALIATLEDGIATEQSANSLTIKGLDPAWLEQHGASSSNPVYVQLYIDPQEYTPLVYGERCFQQADNPSYYLTAVNFRDSSIHTSIEAYAFEGCTHLQYFMSFPNSGDWPTFSTEGVAFELPNQLDTIGGTCLQQLLC